MFKYLLAFKLINHNLYRLFPNWRHLMDYWYMFNDPHFHQSHVISGCSIIAVKRGAWLPSGLWRISATQNIYYEDRRNGTALCLLFAHLLSTEICQTNWPPPRRTHANTRTTQEEDIEQNYHYSVSVLGCSRVFMLVQHLLLYLWCWDETPENWLAAAGME